MNRNNVYDGQQERTVIEVATSLVDSVTHLLFSQISRGNLIVDEQQSPLRLSPRNNANENGQQSSILKMSKSKILIDKMKTIDIDEHKRMIRRFMSQNKRIKRQRQLKSLQLSQRVDKIKEQQEKQRQLSRNKALQQRRKSIEKRLEAKKNLLKEIQKQSMTANLTLSDLQKKKFLYQQKQQQYYKKFVLPKIMEEKQILQSKKLTYRRPMDMKQIIQHEKNYQSFKINSKVNRSLTISVIKSKQSQYSPPQFVPESYKKAKEEQQSKKLEEEYRKKQYEANQIRKRQFVKKIQDLRQKQLQLSKSKSKQKIKPEQPQQQKIKVKPKLNRQQVKNVGNQYLRELLNKNRKFATGKKLKPLSQRLDTPGQSMDTKKNRTQYEIQIIKEERIQQIHKIRYRKIQQLMHNKNMDEHTRTQKLKYEIQKLDMAAEQKLLYSNDLEGINESALIMMNSIQAKMALLGVQIDHP